MSQPKEWEHNKGDPGFVNLRLANIQFASSLLAAFDAKHARDLASLQQAARIIAADQDFDGSWSIERENAVGSPATYGSALATHMALRILRRADLPDVRAQLHKAEGWLRRTQPENIVTAATLLLVFSRDADKSIQSTTRECVEMIRRAQSRDGGWGPYIDSPPEAFDTALVLLALAELPPTLGDQAMIQRGRSFLATIQNDDGSWPATTRPPGGNSYAQRLSTTGWTMLALMTTRAQ